MNLQICSRAALEDMLAHGLPQNAAIISFCDPVGVGRHRHDGYAPIDFRGKCDRVMQIAMDILNKRDFPRETILGTSVVDRDNALIMKMQTAHIGTLDGKIETLNGKINQYLASYATQQVVLYGSLSALLLLVGLLVAVYLSLHRSER